MKTSTLKIDDKEWALAYDFNLIAEAEQEAGCNLLTALEQLSRITAIQLRGLLYAAIVPTPPSIAWTREHPRPTLAQAGLMIRVDTIATITTAIAEAYQLSMAVQDQPAVVAPRLPGKRKPRGANHLGA